MNSVAETHAQVAQALLETGAVGFTPQAPITFKSGLISPVYVDNRRLPYWPDQWQKIIQGFQDVIAQHSIEFEIIAGIETAGIPHSAALGYATHRPSVFVRKQVKDHGTKSRIEGGSVVGKRVLLVEDLITTGGSSLSGVEALREAGATVEDCLAIVSYGFSHSTAAFEQAGVRLHTLTTFVFILERAESIGRFANSEKQIIEDWLRDPAGWVERSGFKEG
jgi:orotate phosphoribosyltransferase